MKVLVIGGTRFFGVHTVNKLLEAGHEVTLATRGKTADDFGDRVSRIILERTNPESMKNALNGKHFDVVIDKIAYTSSDIKYALDVVDCDKYIHMSSTAVYQPKQINTLESDYDPTQNEVVWCSRGDFPYDEIKRQAENALFNIYSNHKSVSVRYPFVIGKDDYTKRLYFYVDHVMRSIPMNIDNIDSKMGFINSYEAGEFMAYLVECDFTGPINGCSNGVLSLREIIRYVEDKCGKKAILSAEGENAPYNGEPEYTINTDLAKSIGFEFSNLEDYIYDLLDYYIKEISEGRC